RQRNTVYDCWGEGMSAWLSDQVTIQDNVIYNNWAENLYVNNITSSLIQRNLVYNTPNNYVGARSGFALADEVTSTTNNPLSSYNRVINNLVYNAQFCAFCWTNVPWSGLSHVLIANNTIVNPAGTLSFQTGAQSNLVPVVNSFSTIVNNIVVGNGAVPSAAGLSLSNNLWSTKPSPAALGAGDIIGDPKLTASGSTAAGQLTAAYFTLQSTSPAIGTGLRLVQVTADFTGAASSLPDIGAY
ncbi:MAG: right-handed parallel beta-helix repeat-containing protein, partial [Burkholderiaceae bacterium]|nr:right-handed parallel beta-helix repeat-containing protein [Burkholderiaceae bacterium]